MPFSFLNTAFLLGLAAAALPILIHLFSRRKVARVPFSSLQFLEEIARKRVRRVRLSQWLILVLRTLAIALLALALGRPACQGNFALGKSRGESAVAIILDDSFSMRAEGERRTLWEKARARAEEVLEAVEAEDRIFLTGVDPRLGEAESYPSRALAQEALRAREPGYGTTDLGSALRRAGAALADATALNKELFIISDFQRSGWGAGVETGVTDLLAELPPKVRVFLLPQGEGRLPNNAIEEARLEGTAIDQRALVQVHRHAADPATDLSVAVEVGGEVLGEALLSVPADGVETAEIPLSRLPAESEDLRARLPKDALSADDVRWVPSQGRGRLRTLIVQDAAQPAPYLPLAMSPEELSGRYEVVRTNPNALMNADFAEVDLVMLDNVTALPREAVSRLREWRAAGGLVFISLGDRVDLRLYNESILPALFPGVSLGNLLGTDETTGASYTLTPRVPSHNAFMGFNAEVGHPLTGATFWRIVEVRTTPGVRTLAEFGPGLPALVEGDGALLFASSLDGRWSNFPTHAAFLPLLHQSLESARASGAGDQVLVGEALEAIVDGSLIPAGAEITARGPESILLDVTSDVVPRGVRLRSTPAPEPGIYEIRAADRVLAREAVNVDPRESDLDVLSADEIRAMFPGDRAQIVNADAPLGTPVREARYGREFWRELIAVVILLLVTEAWLSRRGVA